MLGGAGGRRAFGKGGRAWEWRIVQVGRGVVDKGRGKGEGCKGRDAFRIEELKLVVSKVRGRLV